MHREDLLNTIREYQFYAIDLNLYLDNFPEDKKATKDFRIISSKLNSLIMQYEKHYGPLTNFGTSSVECPPDWVNQPWPWEKCR